MDNKEFEKVSKKIITEHDKIPCAHSIWLYNGSYGLLDDKFNDKHHLRYNTENCFSFQFNEYVCLECGKTIHEKNWKNFENINFVLKNPTDVNPKKYRDYYYTLLQTITSGSAKNEIIREFNKKLIKK